jgi:DNA-binding NtrC family response regulator
MDKVRVLVVDDDQDVLELVSMALSVAGHQVWTARSVAEAEDLLRSQLPDVMVSDWNLGSEYAESLLRRAQQESPRTGRVLLTGSPREDWERLLQDGVAHVALTKPFQFAALERAIETARQHASAVCPLLKARAYDDAALAGCGLGSIANSLQAR